MQRTRLIRGAEGYGETTHPVDGCETNLEVLPMALLLWILAIVLVVAGVMALLRKEMLWGIVLIVVGLLIGPGGTSVFV